MAELLKIMILHASEKTHIFLKTHKSSPVLVYKYSQIGKTPSISELLNKKVFDLIINTPPLKKLMSKTKFTDGKLLRKGVLFNGIKLITAEQVAAMKLEI